MTIEPDNSWLQALAGRTSRMQASEIRELLKLLDQPDVISFAGGIPEGELFPLDEACEIAASLLSDRRSGIQALQYAPSEGYMPLRQWLVEYMAREGVACTTDNILLTTGSQQGLDLLAKLLVDPGDRIAVTAPTYLGALQAFNAYEPTYSVLDPDNPDGLDDGLTVAYLVPDFANPTGETLSFEARKTLVERLRRTGVPLIEDAAYRALRFEGESVPSCLAIDCATAGGIDNTITAYCGTFSKTLSPGLRVGWICASARLVQKLVLAKQASDLHSPPLNQMIIEQLARRCFDTQAARNTEVYRQRRDAMLDALERHMPESVRWTRPEGGMFVWLDMQTDIDGAALLQRSLAEERVAFVPGKAFFADGSGASTIRLNFSMNDAPLIEEGIRRLAGLIERIAAKGTTASAA
ncbi:MAG: PLP-dependent aminotransferase family protein [Geminicoccaceae bacterium]